MEVMEVELAEKKAKVEELLPDYDQIEKDFNEMNKEYEVVKKGIIGAL